MPSNPFDNYTYTFDSGVAAGSIEPTYPQTYSPDRTYAVVSAVSLSTLMSLVNERLDSKQWRVQGGIAFANGAFHQALASETKLSNV